MENKYMYDIFAAVTERTIKRLWVVIILLILALIGSNATWIYYESQWEVRETTVTQDVTQDGKGTNIVSGGDLTYEPESKANDNN